MCFAFSSYISEIDSDRAFESWLRDNSATIEPIDQALFLYLSYYALPFYSVRPEYDGLSAARNIIEVAESKFYAGHDVDELIDIFRPAHFVVLPEDSLLNVSDDYTLCSEIISILSDLRSPIIDQEFASQVHQLLGNNLVSAESVYLALTATRWRYAFLEVFRILETTLHVPWIIDVQRDLGINTPVLELYRSFRGKLLWKEKKGSSVERMFEDLDGYEGLDPFEKRVRLFSDLDFTSSEFSRSKIGRKIWKIRNQLVHPEDFNDGSKLEVNEVEFSELSKYLVQVVSVIFERLPHESLKKQ